MLITPASGWKWIIKDLEYFTNFYIKTQKVENFSFLSFNKLFGTLNIEYEGGDHLLRKMIRMAEIVSFSTCEDCGDLGCLHSNSILEPGQFATLCDKDALRRLYIKV